MHTLSPQAKRDQLAEYHRDFMAAYDEAADEFGLNHGAFIPAYLLGMIGLCLNELWWAGWIDRESWSNGLKAYRPCP